MSNSLLWLPLTLPDGVLEEIDAQVRMSDVFGTDDATTPFALIYITHIPEASGIIALDP